MNEKTHEGEGGSTVIVNKGQDGKAANASAGGSTSEVRGDGSATLQKLKDRFAAGERKQENLAHEVAKQEQRVSERRKRRNEAAARAEAASAALSTAN